jgi:serine/threonine protein phosphatase PrpC
LILHFWALEVEAASFSAESEPEPITYLQAAYERTKEATSKPNEWFGTTTACGAFLSADTSAHSHPVLYVTQLGDSQILVIRPSSKEVIFKTTEQWHWFDCPRQLGTNSPDTPSDNAAMDRVVLQEDDVVLAMTDGVVDNLWEHEVVQNVLDSMEKWHGDADKDQEEQTYADGMRFVAQRLVNAAREIAEDPFAESPYMEKAIDEGLSIEGGMYYLNRLIRLTLISLRQTRRYQRRSCPVQATKRMKNITCDISHIKRPPGNTPILPATSWITPARNPSRPRNPQYT